MNNHSQPREKLPSASPAWFPVRPVAVGLALIGLGAVAVWFFASAPKNTDQGYAVAALQTVPNDRIQPSASDTWESCWRALAAQPKDMRESGLIALLETWVAENPLRALATARAEADPALRDKLLAATLRAWALQDPGAAAGAALSLPEGDRAAAVAAVLSGTVREPEFAVHLAERICREDPSRAREYGCALITALSELGEYRTAVRFAETAAAAVDGEDRLKWLQAAFGRWAGREPELAAVATLRLPDVGARYEAMLAVIGDWVRIDPQGLTEFVQQLPASSDRTNLLGEALQRWVHNNPKAAANWIDRLDPSPELDAGVGALATLPALVAQKPDVALSWAESIVDPAQRSNALTAILRQWSGVDPVAARSYAEHSADLRPTDRQVLLAAWPPST